MARRLAHEDDWEDDNDEWDDAYEGPSEDDGEPTIECPYCGREIHEDSQRCPHCEKYISDEDAPARRKPWWIVIGVILCLYIVYRWIVR
jgi:predicted nucleic acid-binding Zn ribbon protein